jgi:hypothetical protein
MLNNDSEDRGTVQALAACDVRDDLEGAIPQFCNHHHPTDVDSRAFPFTL